MPKLFDIYGDKTHAALSKKSKSSMKYEQMMLGPALAYFHDAIVYEKATVDLLQNVPEAEYTPLLAELWNRMLQGHNTKKGVYEMLCNCYTMIGYAGRCSKATTKLTVELMLYGQSVPSWSRRYTRALSEGVVADTVLSKWLAEFADSSKAKNAMTVTAKQAAGAANRAQRSDHRIGGGPGGD
ncbi:hypothetical protein CYMTET_7247 [Cymbomonas tetramitiformis]|uniref:Uncharacterized protein n=1 Tax=Cymbomonas tetramitiformis TaxID=36881 RepID=A0AAE0GW02_9CHLO|nr:hypothetical protein CYMTET_7247 [Cymbomonas tetramitiformis]